MKKWPSLHGRHFVICEPILIILVAYQTAIIPLSIALIKFNYVYNRLTCGHDLRICPEFFYGHVTGKYFCIFR